MLLGGLALGSLSVNAGQDESQRFITQQVHKLKQQVKNEAVNVKQAECNMQGSKALTKTALN